MIFGRSYPKIFIGSTTTNFTNEKGTFSSRNVHEISGWPPIGSRGKNSSNSVADLIFFPLESLNMFVNSLDELRLSACLLYPGVPALLRQTATSDAVARQLGEIANKIGPYISGVARPPKLNVFPKSDMFRKTLSNTPSVRS